MSPKIIIAIIAIILSLVKLSWDIDERRPIFITIDITLIIMAYMTIVMTLTEVNTESL